jgi:hypothetical protein
VEIEAAQNLHIMNTNYESNFIFFEMEIISGDLTNNYRIKYSTLGQLPTTKLEPIATTVYHFATYYVDDFNNELQFCGVTDEVIVDKFKYH